MNRMVSSAGGRVPGWCPQMPGRGTRPDDAGAVSSAQAPPDRDGPAAAPSDETCIVLEGNTLVAAVAALAGICVLAFLLGLLAGGETRAQEGVPPLDAAPTPAGASRVRLLEAERGRFRARVNCAHGRRVPSRPTGIGWRVRTIRTIRVVPRFPFAYHGAIGAPAPGRPRRIPDRPRA